MPLQHACRIAPHPLYPFSGHSAKVDGQEVLG
eukprot:CAMPEP_0180380214 /NCGR_PEP_ID=MMETSP0989-20121125/25872_1 /TAXON_ID=697907 /ORGANISM="non described non described, Strain CCMP2293" /LENGTH=31 /DNA_ID= /DNA_START= /DNA_END= /DNA_ORIENTATION=